MRLTLSTCLTAAAAALSMGAASASTSGIVISQVYGGNGTTFNRDYVELFNAGSAAVSITGWSVQYASATGTGNFSATAVNGTLQPGQYFLVGMSSAASGAALPTPDASGSTSMSSTAGKVILANVATSLACNGGSAPCSAAQLAQIVDAVGYGTANFSETAAAPALTSSTALFRAINGCTDSGSNAADFTPGTPAPRNSASPLAPCGGNQAIVASCPASANVAVGVVANLALSATDADDVVNAVSFVSGNVAGMSLTGFTPSPAAGAAATATLSLASSVAAGTYPVVVRFSNAVPQQANCTINVTVSSGGGSFTPIASIQGSGNTSPLLGQTVTTRGIVTKLNNNGYYLQDAAGDGNSATSEGLFIFTDTVAPTVSVGQSIEVSGTVSEFNTGDATNALTLSRTVTELSGPGTPLVLGSGSITPTVITLPEAFDGELERYEGMLVTINTPLTVSQNFFQGRYGQVTLSAGGRLVKPTDTFRPGTPSAVAQASLNLRSSILLDDGLSTQNPNPIPYIGVDNTLRAGDTMPSVTGVIDYGLATNQADGLADWRIHPTVPPVITRVNARTTAPALAGGNLTVASFNVLNYFTTFGNGQTAFGGTGQVCPPSNNLNDCRGADNAAEFTRQRDKIVAAMAALNADVVGLMEIQNNGTVAAQNLVDGINAVMGANTYAVVPNPPSVGTDAIRVAMIYKPARVLLVGGALSDAAAIHNRPPLAQTFRLVSNNEKFSVVVNHFKSKNCPDATGADLDQGDGQGCYNAKRVLQSQALLSFIETVKTAATDTDVLVIGDLNAYGQEDPIFTLTSAGLVNQPLRFEATPHSYVFDGEQGMLDHALATASLSTRVLGATHWAINADEPSVIDYNTEFKTQDLYTVSPYRASDHDPVVLSIDLQGPVAQTISFTAPADQLLGAADFGLIGSASSGLPVVFTTQTAAVCTVSGSTLHLVAVGTCTVAANQAGNANFLAAPQVLRSFTVRQTQTVSFAPLAPRTLTQGGFTLAATASSGLPVVYTSNSAAVCTVAGNAVTLVAAGTCSVTASQAGNGQWAAATGVTQTFAVTAAPVDGDVPLPLWALGLLGVGLMSAMRKARSAHSG